MSEWTTDRPPTEADGDEDGNVQMRQSPCNSCFTLYVHWSYVKEEVPWQHTHEWKPPAPKPEQTPPAAEIPLAIRTSAEPFYVLVVSDAFGHGGGGDPIVWERRFPQGTTLQAVLQQQARFGNQYGTSYVAECRIIPELTRNA